MARKLHLVVFLPFVLGVIVMLSFRQPLQNVRCYNRSFRKHTKHIAPNEVHLSVILSFLEINEKSVHETVSKLIGIGCPCSRTDVPKIPAVVNLVLYSPNTFRSEAEVVKAAIQSLEDHISCFSDVLFLVGNQRNGQDHQLLNRMFFDLFLNESLRTKLIPSTHYFWMESDVIPIREGWLDALVLEAGRSEFWMSGSVFKGDGLDIASESPENELWLGRINGNALYNARDEKFRQFIKIVSLFEPPETSLGTFDLSIWRVLHAFPYTWPFYQRYRSKFFQSSFLDDWDTTLSPADSLHSKARGRAFLVHGSSKAHLDLLDQALAHRSRVNPPDALTRATDLSIMVRCRARDGPFALETALSIARHAQAVAEAVFVTSAAEAPHLNASLAKGLAAAGAPSLLYRVVSEPKGVEMVRRPWSRFHADQLCRGRLVLHMESGTVLWRPLQTRDLFWLGRPVLAYRPLPRAPEPSPRTLRVQAVLGVNPVEHEFGSVPLVLHPRELYARAREHLLRRHGVNVTQLLHRAEFRGLSDLESLGNFLFTQARELDLALAPTDGDDRRRLHELIPPPALPPVLCLVNVARAMEKPEWTAATVAALQDMRTHGLNCDRIPWF